MAIRATINQLHPVIRDHKWLMAHPPYEKRVSEYRAPVFVKNY
jgi:hypothetical protein